MIIKSLFDIVSRLILWVLSLINLPDMPDMIVDVLEQLKSYLLQGANILSLFVNWDLLVLLCSTCLIVIIARETYSLLMWVIQKIPFLGIK